MYIKMAIPITSSSRTTNFKKWNDKLNLNFRWALQILYFFYFDNVENLKLASLFNTNIKYIVMIRSKTVSIFLQNLNSTQ